jgi:4-carboxymuconolactone decarboxylase
MAGEDVQGELFERGLAVRREVLGAEYVDASLTGASELMAPMQQFVTAYAWGAVWARPGLDRRSRSVLNLGMLTALGRLHELGVHVRGALRNGLTREEIREALLQTGIYCGMPAALEAFRVADRVFHELDAEAAAGGGGNG